MDEQDDCEDYRDDGGPGAYDLGYHASDKWVRIEANPYPEDTEAHALWRSGWRANDEGAQDRMDRCSR